jgi:hypothetical protein
LLKILQKANYWRAAKHWQRSETTSTSMTVSQVIKEGGMSGVPIKSSVNADQTRVDFLDLSNCDRAVLKDIDFYEVNGNTVFAIFMVPAEGLAASYIFYFDLAMQVCDHSPRPGAYIDSLARPSGY